MKSFLKILPFIKPQWKLILASALLSIPMSLVGTSPAFLVKYLIDNILVNKPKDARIILAFSGAIVGIYVINMIVRFLFGYCSRLANETVMRNIRERLFWHYLSMSSSFFTESSIGGLMSRVMSDVAYVSQYIINLSMYLKQVFTLIGVFAYAAYLNPKLLGVTVLVTPALSWLSTRSGKLMKGYANEMQKSNGQVFSSLQEAFGGFRVIKSFCLEKFAFDRFKFRNDSYVRYALKAARVEEVVAPTVELMGALSIALVIYVGGRDVVHGRLSAGDLSAFFACFALMINPIRVFNDLNMKFSQAAAAADRIDEVLVLESPIQETPDATELPLHKGQLEFRKVGFRYEESHPWVFRDVSFQVSKGKTVALVGASGQGKSTLVSLVPRFYDPQEGQVLIDGIDIKGVTLESLRKQIALVNQDVFLFNESIYDNIASGHLGATKDEIEDAARAAHAYDFIQALPDGFQTIVGERGQRLSGGERQRISIARALLKNAPLLILDEATSSLDSASERAVQSALEHLMEGRTTLVVAHRLSTIRHSHEILVFADGKIAERGQHQELMEMRGAYARFHALLT